jgi:putative addiction module CopG family antidote
MRDARRSVGLDREGALNHAGNQPSLAASEEGVMDSRRLSIELSKEMAEIVEALVKSGSYADASEVIQEALELFTREDEPLEEWQERELAAAYDEWKANPTAVYTVEEVRAHLEERRQRG